jgi:hypothetical protein
MGGGKPAFLAGACTFPVMFNERFPLFDYLPLKSLLYIIDGNTEEFGGT